MTSPKVLVVIVSYNGREYLGDCLGSLQACTYPKESFEILVVDNASTDGSVAYLREGFAEIAIIESNVNLGFAAANNLGFEHAVRKKFDYVYLLNQDTVVDPDFLTAAVATSEHSSDIGAVQSRLMLYEQQEVVNSRGNEIHFLGFGYAGGYGQREYRATSSDIAYASGAGVLIRISALKQVGFFNPDFFMYHEDLDLGWRLWLAGYRVRIAPDSVVYHKYEFSRSMRKFYFMERNRHLVLLQNYAIGTLIVLALPLLLADVALVLVSLRSGWFNVYARSWAYLLNPRHWRSISVWRRRVQKTRRIPDREILQRFTGSILFQEISSPWWAALNPLMNFYFSVLKRVLWW